ncbi:radical SAM protein [Amphritea balenae]|uniref:Radical SAM protein n=1 Tax=Amphritea balenae TaxID=452629 RepID=A0A3P1SLU2_9GAMM|nr:radical SAM protein [Amphritea balenae]RRC97970.1 radical SAM protein [Amphritea balenae]GGK82178.1 radical SAM protein [Amphritea balenae]
MHYQYPPVDYIEPVYRPPSEANSLILQVTNGCSRNYCTYCEMYTDPQKKFKPKQQDQVLQEIIRCSEQLNGVRRVFLGDGDAMVLSFKRLKAILEAIRQYLPSVTRVSAYALPSNLQNKTVEQLQELHSLGLSLIYVGAESGDDEVLKCINKGETYESTRDALLKARQAGIKTSVMLINGIGGTRFSKQHALNSARLINEVQPEYLATLVLFFRNGSERLVEGYGGDFTPLNQIQLFQEMELFLSNLQLEKTIFRSDHASNYLVLKGVLNRDLDSMLQQLHKAIHAPDKVFLRSNSARSF